MAGRTTEARTITVGTTNTSTALTGAAGTFDKSDVGRTITGTGIPAGATIAAVASSTAATLSAAATATGGSVSAVVGAVGATTLGFQGWSPESQDEANTYTVAANIAGTATPDRQTTNNTPVTNNSRRNR